MADQRAGATPAPRAVVPGLQAGSGPVPAWPSGRSDLGERVRRIRAEIAELVALEPVVDSHTGPALHADLCRAADQLRGLAARVLARVEADGRWSAGTARTFPEWVAGQQLASRGSVRRAVELGRALDGDLPRTARAVEHGEVTLEHAQVLARAAGSSPARRAALTSGDPERNEAALLAQAARTPVDRFRRVVDRWAATVDATAAESEHDAARAKEYVSLARRPDGVALQGFLTLENAELVATALRAVAGVPAKGDTRTKEERQAAALVDAAHLVLDRGLAGGGNQVRPHLMVHIPLETLERLQQGDAAAAAPDGAAGRVDPACFDAAPPAELSDGTPLPPSALARLVCDGELTRVVFAADGAVLDVGRAQRTYTGQQRLAVIARDVSCRFPGCGAPPTLGEIHHVLSWVDHGRTSVANGILLCWFHHGLVHRRGIRIRRARGAWEFRREDGSVIGDVASRDDARPGGTPTRGSPPGGTRTQGAPPGGTPTQGAPPGGRGAWDEPGAAGPRPSRWGGPRRQSAQPALPLGPGNP
ncbi:DUF222 domain-containing protein [Isoptericola sp. b441]|uniref:DUF222 domain-containing protein n=1 Tax=Actinotalea lenta TaxID=3064654 RepID=A0ABT9DD70_9CELL|nr:DUF222 domain-containing protein [Isoptericola sp. b441]MDO8108580.1 DUF222 domain-containing protein [Isoptericola sp. b441]